MALIRASLLAVVALVMSGSAGIAQTDYPTRRIQILLPYPAGGIVDIVTRIVAEKLSEQWAQPIIVESKPGANGNIAWDQVSRAEPDGYTWTFFSPAVIANPRMQPSVRWNEKSFIPVAAVVWAPSVVVVNPALPVNTMKEFIDYVRKSPGVVSYANPGTGTSQHLNTAIMLNAAKLEMTSIPYRGQPAGILDLVANRVSMKVASIGLVAQHIQTGALRPLAVLGKSRSPMLPNVPTMTEAGFPEINVVAWYGYSVPRGTPQPIVEKIHAGFSSVLKDSGVRSALEKQALQVVDPMSLAEIGALVEADTLKYAKVIEDANIRLND